MPLDLDAKAADLNTLPRFQRAAFHARRLRALGFWLGAVALAMLLAVRAFPAVSGPSWKALLVNNAAALLALVAGLHSAGRIARWRARVTKANVSMLPLWWQSSLRPNTTEDVSVARWYRRWPRRMFDAIGALLGGETCHAVVVCTLAAIACLLVMNVRGFSLNDVPLGKVAYVAGGGMVLFAFALLVLERYFANSTPAEWPEAAHVAPLARIAIATLLLSALGLFLSEEGKLWPARLALLAGLLPALVALEIALRAALSLFVRTGERVEPRLFADSILAALLRWPPQPLRTLQDELHSRFGIDLRQNWAFSFMRQAFLPVLTLVAAGGWLFSGLHEIPIEGRGIYERFGRPIEVLHPGLHVGLPWPLSRVRPVENGVVHQLVTTLGDNDDGPDLSTAEGPAPAGANRLWDASHVSEKSQVIASASGDRQGFQVVYMDVRFVYRIGLTDAAALAATYNTEDVPTLIRSTASRVLVRDFASRTLEGVLGEKRIALARDVGAAVQKDLDALSSGVEILATLIEAIHPPAGAANAYHSVQAAQIKALATIARERGRAAERVNDARMNASMAENKAAAAAREARASAEVVQLRFAAEHEAHRTAGKAFLLEQYLGQLGQGLTDAKLVVLDHRINGAQAPTIDLRTYAGSGDPVAMRSAQP